MMPSCTLQPPNSDRLSDDLICNVVQRVNRSSLPPPVMAHDRVSSLVPSSPSSMEQVNAMLEDQKTLGVSDFKSSQHYEIRKDLQLPLTLKPRGSDETIIELLLLSKKIERERRRINQRRYRKKQGDRKETLEINIQHLREEIRHLAQKRHGLCSPHISNMWSVAVEYFRLFRFGLRSTSQGQAQQSSFVQSVVTPDVVFNASRGEGHVMHSWRWFSLWFDGIVVELEELQNDGNEAVLATTATSFTITESTLWNVFPHLCGGEMPTLASKLLHQRVVVRGWTRFEWDCASYRVASIAAEADLLTPILKLLGSLENVSILFEKALISPAFQWRSQ